MDEAESSHRRLALRDDCDGPEVSAAASPGHVFAGHNYPTINISGHAQVHLGDQHYQSAPQDEIERIASSLYFPDIHRRYESIVDAHSDTFDWIFEPPGRQQPLWSSFVDWLKNEQPLYWVSGKPGSGKSTLMKHVIEHIQQEHQKDRQHAPIVLSFWFWEAGNKLEHSLIGCLRSLLWQLLQDKRSCHAVVQSIQRSNQPPWTIKRLKDGLFKTLQQLSLPVLLFLDGLDEAGVEGEGLLASIRDLVQSRYTLKLCVSSRPDQAYIDEFSCYPKLRVQDLNGGDIDAIIAQDLLGNPSVTRLAQSTAKSSLKDLAASIRWRADGVLLWVRLVVSSLLRGIQNLDDVRTLQRRVDEMPGDLEELYAQILHRNNHDHKHYAADVAFYFQFLLHREGNTNLIEFCLAINDDLRTWCMDPDTGWDAVEIHAKFDFERIRTWISARTGGLLEVYEVPTAQVESVDDQHDSNPRDEFASWYDKYIDCDVGFIHRTARTFVSETITGKSLLLPSTISPAELVRVCFESRFIAWVIFGALKGWRYRGWDKNMYSLLLSCLDEGERRYPCMMPPQSVKVSECACDGLLAKGYLLLNEFLTPASSPSYFFFNSWPSSDGSTIDYCSLYCRAGLWEHMQQGLERRRNDVDYLSILLVYTVEGMWQGRDVLCRDAGAAPFLRLIELGAHPCRQITFYTGESICLLPFIAKPVSDLVARRYPIGTITHVMLRFDLSNTLGNLPLITSCNDYWLRYSPDQCLYFWGDLKFSIAREYFEGANAGRSGLRLCGGGVYICCEGGGDTAPRLFAISSEDPCRILDHPDIRNSLSFDDTGDVFLRLPPNSAYSGNVRPLRSLREALRYMGKSEESIHRFATAEETRLRQRGVGESTIGEWKSWFFGSDTNAQQDNEIETDVQVTWRTNEHGHCRRCSIGEDSEADVTDTRSLGAVSDISQSLQSSEHHSLDTDPAPTADHDTATSEQGPPLMRCGHPMDDVD